MIVHGLVFLVCASLGTELRARAISPSRTSNGEIIFELYTKQRPTSAQELNINDEESLSTGGFDSSKPTYIITHGLQINENISCALIRDAYIAHTDSNVIVVDWSSYGTSSDVTDEANMIKVVSETVKQFINWLYANGLNADDLTLVGHSDGAHVMGLAGYKLEPKVNNIVGLDPAPVGFKAAGYPLSWIDAKHVQIIHTNGDGFGYLFPHGHSDFYPNGGKEQPGCSDVEFDWSACSHYRSIELFAESISMTFVGTECGSYENFDKNNCGTDPKTATMGGLDLASVEPGVYYLRTGSAPPFSIVGVEPAGDVQAAIP